MKKNKIRLGNGFAAKLSENVKPAQDGEIRIMSSNLLVGYKSWGGLPVKPRAAMYVSLIQTVKPDVIGVQEMCDGWYCAIRNNLPKGYKMLYPFSTGVFVRMTAMIYNADRLDVVQSGQIKYKKGDNPRLRRVVWAVFEDKQSKKRFAVTNTHFDLLREGQEERGMQTMQAQCDELLELIRSLHAEYDCPVFATGDFNTKEDTPETPAIDAPEIYERLAGELADSKYAAEECSFGAESSFADPSYDHIFINGTATAKRFTMLSDPYMNAMSDHYPIYTDLEI
ncbi:MAG TPA: hypothetical protein IAA37_05410 [Candidatus Eubacterium faecale]|uniref:Endonuclease/exonuclease/phosphatase domain-containing protein n=1 Tax=Candidatus Eubacterium faecale TaxID=2838568 RepID=A0A9D2MJB4_9FIRM|nr:hypothetical protein [Candidatus Eubacterium faecale]